MTLTATRPRIHYSLAGDAGPVVLLIMGFGMQGAVWRPQIDGLAKTHRVISYDHLGVAGSDAPEGLPDMRSMAADARRVLDAAGVTAAHVVGVSMGGMIAQELALTSPARVLSLTLIATHAGGLRAVLPRWEGLRRFAAANTGGPAERVAALKRLLYTPDFLARVDVEQLDRRITDMAGRRAPRRIVLGHLAAVMKHRTRRRLRALRIPTLVMRPGLDILVDPKNSDVLARVIPGAKVMRFDDAGHGITFQCAAEVNAAIAAHVASSA